MVDFNGPDIVLIDTENKTALVIDPVNIDNIWRIRNKMEIDRLIEGADIIRFIKAQRIKWLGHVQRKDQARPARKLLDWKPIGTRPVGRPRQR